MVDTEGQWQLRAGETSVAKCSLGQGNTRGREALGITYLVEEEHASLLLG